MQTLRWVLGTATAVGTAGFVVLIIFGNGFRRSFGASENSALKVSVILLVQASLLASIVAPHQHLLMHTIAVIVIALMAGCLWIRRESAFWGLTGLAYGGAWIGYYWLALGGRR